MNVRHSLAIKLLHQPRLFYRGLESFARNEAAKISNQ